MYVFGDVYLYNAEWDQTEDYFALKSFEITDIESPTELCTLTLDEWYFHWTKVLDLILVE